MHIICQKEDLLYGVQAVSKAVSGKNTLPILSGIMISAQDNRVVLKATDLEMAIECVIDAETPREGTVVAPGRYLIDLVRHLPSGEIGLESADGQQLLISYEQSQIAVRCFDAEEFPALPVMEGKVKREMPSPLFRRMIKQVAAAAATDEIRPLFTGILLEMLPEKLVMVATDTHRMAVGECPCGGEEDARVIVPSRNMQEIARLAVNDDEPVFIVTDKNQVYFRTGNVTFISRVISGQYPEYKQVLPAPSLFSAQAVLDRQRFLEALERASLVVRETGRLKGNAVKLKWREEAVVLSADVPDVGKIKEEIFAVFEGKQMETSFNARYLLEALKVMESEKVVMRLTGPATPSVIVPEEDQSYLYLVLPLRVGN